MTSAVCANKLAGATPLAHEHSAAKIFTAMNEMNYALDRARKKFDATHS